MLNAVGLVLLLLYSCHAWAQQPSVVEPHGITLSPGTRPVDGTPTPVEVSPEPLGPEEEAESLYDLITAIVLDNLPDEYEDTRHWGMTKDIWRGVRFSGKPLELKMNSRKRRVNHGTWRMYRITLVDPEKRFRARIANVGGADNGRVGFDAIVTARLSCFARLSKWESGVQLISLSTDAQADVQLRLRCEVGVRLDVSEILPALVLDPRVTDAHLTLQSFRVQRISRLEGHLAHQLGKNLRGVLVRKIESKRQKMVDRINGRIEKNRDKLRLSLADLGEHAWDELLGLAGSD
jgi:hypothetical protein